MPRRISSSGIVAVMSCRLSWPIDRRAERGWRRPSVRWTRSVRPSRRPMSRGSRPAWSFASAPAAGCRDPNSLPPEQHSDRWRRSQTRNVTDPDSRIVSHRGQLIQGYNAQVAVAENRVILAAGVTNSPNDSNQLVPASRQALDALARLGIDAQTSTVLADGGYWNAAMIADLTDRGLEVLIPPDGPKTTGPDRSREPRQGPQRAADRGDARDRAGQSALPPPRRNGRAGVR